ncbi:hypothetical protein Tco_0809943 [Tanacetum coccineum]
MIMKAGLYLFSATKPYDQDSYVMYLDFFKDFENEFPAIVYNDAQMSKSDYLTKQTLSPQHNNESDLMDETSLSEYDEVGQNILYFNDLFPFNVIHPDDLKSDEDNDNNEIDVIQSSEGGEITHMGEGVYTSINTRLSWEMDVALSNFLYSILDLDGVGGLVKPQKTAVQNTILLITQIGGFYRANV